MGSVSDARDGASRTGSGLLSARPWLAAGAVALVAAAALFLPLEQGIPRAADLPDHLGTTAQVLREFHQGKFYPRWMPDFHDGLGEPTLLYYPPGLYQVAAFLALLVHDDVLIGLFGALALFVFLGALGMFFLVRRRSGALAAALGALLFAILPYRIFELYASGLDSAFAAGCLLPWVFLTLSRVSEDGQARSAGRIGWPLLFAAVVWVNLPTALLLSYLVAVWAGVDALAKRRLWLARRVLMGMVAGSLFAAAYLLPAVVELPEIQIPTNARAHYISNFLFQGGASWMTPGLRSVFDRMALYPAAGLAISIALLLAGKQALFGRDDRDAGLLGTVAVTAFFLMTPPSLLLWKFLPFLHQVNLPWRLLEPFGTACVFFMATGAAALWRPAGLSPVLRVLGVGVFAVLLWFWALFGSALSSANGKVPADSCRAAIPRFAHKEGYFLAKGARPISEVGPRPLVSCSRPCRVRVLEWSPTRRRLAIAAPEGARVVLRTYFFPGWAAFRVGARPEALKISTEPGSGLIVIDVPPGQAELLVRFGTTAVRVAGWLVSAVSLGLAFLLQIRKRRSNRRSLGILPPTESDPSPARPT